MKPLSVEIACLLCIQSKCSLRQEVFPKLFHKSAHHNHYTLDMNKVQIVTLKLLMSLQKVHIIHVIIIEDKIGNV